MNFSWPPEDFLEKHLQQPDRVKLCSIDLASVSKEDRVDLFGIGKAVELKTKISAICVTLSYGLSSPVFGKSGVDHRFQQSLLFEDKPRVSRVKSSGKISTLTFLDYQKKRILGYEPI